MALVGGGGGGDLHGLCDLKGENFLGSSTPLGDLPLASPSLERAGFLGILTSPGPGGSFVSLALLGPFSLTSLGFLGES